MLAQKRSKRTYPGAHVQHGLEVAAPDVLIMLANVDLIESRLCERLPKKCGISEGDCTLRTDGLCQCSRRTPQTAPDIKDLITRSEPQVVNGWLPERLKLPLQCLSYFQPHPNTGIIRVGFILILVLRRGLFHCINCAIRTSWSRASHNEGFGLDKTGTLL